LIEDILKSDYNIKVPDTYKNFDFKIEGSMIKAISVMSFGGLFSKIFGEKASENLRFNELGDIFDIITACLEFDPIRRPTISQLFHSTIFKLNTTDYDNA
jgi:serine/threonine protein kinase